jgi:hypothetical protein
MDIMLLLPEEELLISIKAFGVYWLGRGESSIGSTREITEKTTTPTIAIMVIRIIMTLRRQRTAKRSIRDLSSSVFFSAGTPFPGSTSYITILYHKKKIL